MAILWFLFICMYCCDRSNQQSTIPTSVPSPVGSICDYDICSCVDDFKNVTCKCDSSKQELTIDAVRFGRNPALRRKVEYLTIEGCKSVRMGHSSILFNTELKRVEISSVESLKIEKCGFFPRILRHGLVISIVDSTVTLLGHFAFMGHIRDISFKRCQFRVPITAQTFRGFDDLDRIIFSESVLSNFKTNVFENIKMNQLKIELCRIDRIKRLGLNFKALQNMQIIDSAIDSIHRQGIQMSEAKAFVLTNTSVRILHYNGLDLTNIKNTVNITDCRFKHVMSHAFNTVELNESTYYYFENNTLGNYDYGALNFLGSVSVDRIRLRNLQLNKTCGCDSLECKVDKLLGENNRTNSPKENNGYSTDSADPGWPRLTPIRKACSSILLVINELSCMTNSSRSTNWQSYRKQFCSNDEKLLRFKGCPTDADKFTDGLIQESLTTTELISTHSKVIPSNITGPEAISHSGNNNEPRSSVSTEFEKIEWETKLTITEQRTSESGTVVRGLITTDYVSNLSESDIRVAESETRTTTTKSRISGSGIDELGSVTTNLQIAESKRTESRTTETLTSESAPDVPGTRATESGSKGSESESTIPDPGLITTKSQITDSEISRSGISEPRTMHNEIGIGESRSGTAEYQSTSVESKSAVTEIESTTTKSEITESTITESTIHKSSSMKPNQNLDIYYPMKKSVTISEKELQEFCSIFAKN